MLIFQNIITTQTQSNDKKFDLRIYKIIFSDWKSRWKSHIEAYYLIYLYLIIWFDLVKTANND